MNGKPEPRPAERPRVQRSDTERIDAIERGDVEIECMGTTTRYFNAWTRTSELFTTADGKRDVRKIIDDALDQPPIPHSQSSGVLG